MITSLGKLKRIVNQHAGPKLSGYPTSVKTTTTTQGASLSDFAALIAQMRELLQSSNLGNLGNLNEDDRDTIETNLKIVEKEAEKEKPRLKLIESSLSSIKSLVESTETIGSAAAKLMPMLSQAADFARQLFP